MSKDASRFVKCYKYGFNFTIWESTDETGDRVLVSGCSAVYDGPNGERPKCNGINDHGRQCPYAQQESRPAPDTSQPG